MRRLIFPVLLAVAAAAFAQKQPAPPPATTTTLVTDTDSRDTRERFRELLQRNPPQVGMILKLDPSLFSNQQYLASYPALAAFVAEHPEVPHNPEFYLASVYTPGEREPRTGSNHVWEQVMDGVFILLIVGTIVGVFTWLIRTIVEQRRWSRLARVQSEVHGRLLERFTSNEELLRYIDTPAGRRFLESAPIPLEAGPRQFSAPVGRIIWSVQAGLVLAAAGIGLQFVSSGIDKDAAQPMWALGIVALCVGIGFIFSGIVSFVLSRRLKLLEPPTEAPSV